MDHNTLEQEIFINASLQEVWQLVSTPAWWVGDQGPDHVTVDGRRLVADCTYGRFPVLIEDIEAPTTLVCRWASAHPGEEPIEGNSTLIAFHLRSENDGTRLSVREKGFAHLDVTEGQQVRSFKENIKGWEWQLNVIKQKAESNLNT
ncbi:SRPBCC domain-containing protein [Sporolactobacillus kofuensis]|uniref:SRPBCC domain-containing protein n=1 Tax=Sporolactobacillus kofuensis TaxID=269672 RepID=A0ABW1WDP3_9BACL|nr:SRPBCC domain-containing protein [Sporolactobacillus kofuensis]MCO7175354.1 SRPBCC domain-containing protein [Sporolactobacillus kofuensis]